MKLEVVIGSIVLIALGVGAFLALRASQDIMPAPIGTTEATSTVSAAPAAPAAKKALLYKKAPELVSPDGYINTAGKPITIGQFRGKKVVLIDIWTYSCINCERTLPYLKDWYSKYSDKGLEIIGVHTPEFSFERVLKNVQHAVTEKGIRYPVVLDNAYKTWNAFDNQYWPRKYLIDIDGYIVYDHAGEGDYDGAEKAIQKALAERAQRLGVAVGTDMPMSAPAGAVPVDFGRVRSPETYFGAERNDRLGNGVPRTEGDQTLTIPATIKANAAYLSGTWHFQPEYATNKTAGAQIRYTYEARGVYFVASADTPVRLTITRDGGKPLGAARGADVAADGTVTISKNGLYKLIEDTDYGVHTLEIQIEEPGLNAYTFTFG